jgi:hypothetical protein
MFRKLYCAMAVIIIFTSTGLATAQPPRNPPPSRPGIAAGTQGTATPASSKFLAIPGLLPLGMASVQREIALTPEQRQQLKAVSDGYAATVQQLGKTFDQLDTGDKQKQGAQFSDRAAQAARNAQRGAESILSPQQLQTVKRIALELSATGALADPNVQSKIGLSAEQQQRLTRIFEQAGEKMQQLQRDTAAQAMQVLDGQQTAALRVQIETQKKP